MALNKKHTKSISDDESNVSSDLEEFVNKSKTIKNPSNFSDDEPDNLSDDTISKYAEKKALQNEFYEKVIKFVETDDLIRNETAVYREKMRTLKEDKKDLEQHILISLDRLDEEFVSIRGKGKLIKSQSITKGALKKELIEEAFNEGAKENGIFQNDDKKKFFIDKVIGLIDEKRPTKVRTYIRRTREKKTG